MKFLLLLLAIICCTESFRLPPPHHLMKSRRSRSVSHINDLDIDDRVLQKDMQKIINALIKDSLETLQNGPIKVPLFTGNTGKFSKK